MNGAPVVGKDLHEMLRDAPMLNDSNEAVHSGTTPTTQNINFVRPTTLPQRKSSAKGLCESSGLVQNGDTQLENNSPSKIEFIKNWGISTYKCTRQLMYEKLGKTSRTVDSELESQIEYLRDTQRKYLNILRLTRNLVNHFYHVVHTQHALGESFADLAQKSPGLQQEFIFNSDLQRTLSKNGEMLLNALNFFLSSVNTLCNKTIEDTLVTVRQYETARIEYDAYRTDLESLAQAPRTDVNNARVDEAQLSFQKHKQEFEGLRSDVSVKLKLLDENKVKVMHQQLLLFHSAVSAYFSGNHDALENTMKQFCIKNNKVSPPALCSSWLEQ